MHVIGRKSERVMKYFKLTCAHVVLGQAKLPQEVPSKHGGRTIEHTSAQDRNSLRTLVPAPVVDPI